MNTPLPLVDGNTLFLDNSRFEYIMQCMRSAEYGIIHKRVTNETKQALVFGEAIHLALKYRYKFCSNGPVSTEHQIRQFMLLEKFYESHPVPMGDHRTLAFAQGLIQAYNIENTHEPFIIMHTPEGVPLVEEGFAIPLGKIGDINVVWKGRLDLCVKEATDEIWVFDNKTTSIGGDYFMTEYFTSNQMKGYTWACRKILGTEVKGAQINGLIARKPSKTGKGFEFKRGKFVFEDDVLEEWVGNTLHIVSDFLHSYSRGYFPMESSQCIKRFGACQYIDVCRLSPGSRFRELHSESFKSDIFDPLHEDAIDLEVISKAPIPENYQLATEPTKESDSPDQMSALMASLLNIN